MPAIKELGLYPVQLPHPDRKIPLRSLNEKMVMVVHEAIGVTDPTVTGIHMIKEVEESSPVFVITED